MFFKGFAGRFNKQGIGNEKNISTKQNKTCPLTWIFEKNVNKGGKKND